MRKVQLVEENVLTPFALLQTTSFYPETLNVVESRQYRERVLHISDNAHVFFMSLEQKRVEQINTKR